MHFLISKYLKFNWQFIIQIFPMFQYIYKVVYISFNLDLILANLAFLIKISERLVDFYGYKMDAIFL